MVYHIGIGHMGAGNCSASTYCKDEVREKKVFKNLKRIQNKAGTPAAFITLSPQVSLLRTRAHDHAHWWYDLFQL